MVAENDRYGGIDQVNLYKISKSLDLALC